MFAIILLVMMSLLFVLFIAVLSGVFLGCILYVPGSGLRTLETGVGTLVLASMAASVCLKFILGGNTLL